MNTENETSSDSSVPIAPVKASPFAGISFKDVLKTSIKEKQHRLLSDTELLSDAQYAFLEDYTQKKFYTFMQNHWANKGLPTNLMTTTDKGEQIQISWHNIKVIDKRWKGASHCICGKAVRYEYWIGTYGPIGSIHILEHTGLSKELVNDITKGYKLQNELRTEIVHILDDLKQAGKTYNDWCTDFSLTEKMAPIDYVPQYDRELINKLNEFQLPLTEKLRAALTLAANKRDRALRQPVVAAVMAVPAVTSENPVATPATVDLLRDRIDSLFGRIFSTTSAGEQLLLPVLNQYHYGQVATLRSLAKVIVSNKASYKQRHYATDLCDVIEKVIKLAAKPVDMQDAARQALSYIVNQNPNDVFARSLYENSLKRDLTDKQLKAIFYKEKNSPIDCLYHKYLLNNVGLKNPFSD